MIDTVDRATRSQIMARVRGKHTSPEMLVRKLLHNAGYRYRLHRKDLPGTPDLVFPGRRKLIFINGCFWHRHEGCKLARIPKTRVEFWTEKLNANKARDERNISALRMSGWDVLVLWECELANHDELLRRITDFLNTANSHRGPIVADDETKRIATRDP